MEQLITVLMLWINLNSEFTYAVDRGLPRVEKIDQSTLAAKAYKGNISKAEIDEISSQYTAIYDHDGKTIYIGDYVDPDTEEGKAVLVHELVHFVQYQNGLADDAQCVHALEPDAYHVQAQYLNQQGLSPEFDAFTVKLRGICPEHWGWSYF